MVNISGTGGLGYGWGGIGAILLTGMPFGCGDIPGMIVMGGIIRGVIGDNTIFFLIGLTPGRRVSGLASLFFWGGNFSEKGEDRRGEGEVSFKF